MSGLSEGQQKRGKEKRQIVICILHRRGNLTICSKYAFRVHLPVCNHIPHNFTMHENTHKQCFFTIHTHTHTHTLTPLHPCLIVCLPLTISQPYTRMESLAICLLIMYINSIFWSQFQDITPLQCTIHKIGKINL